jgi:L-seryl-tRNA(Ser) seleniumtransferase
LLVRERQLVVHRAHAVRLPGGLSLPDAFTTLLPVIQEVGAIDQVHPGDFDSLDRFCAIMADDGHKGVAPIDFGSKDASQAVVLPIATFAASSIAEIPSVEAVLSAGADYVIIPGDGVCGGPACGILVGPTDELRRIQSSHAWDSLRASDAVQAMILVTLEMAASEPDRIPVRSLLSTAEQNLRARAERLATRLSGSDLIKSCQVTADDAKLTSEGRWRFPSRQLRVRHVSLEAATWQRNLQDELPAIMANVSGEDLCVDLRWISPADDARLGEALGGKIA